MEIRLRPTQKRFELPLGHPPPLPVQRSQGPIPAAKKTHGQPLQVPILSHADCLCVWWKFQKSLLPT